MRFYILLFLLLLHAVSTFGREFFSSMAQMNDKLSLLRRGRVHPELTGLIVIQEKRLGKIKSLAKTLGELSGDEIRDPNFTVHHPLNAFRFIRNHSGIFNTTATKLLEEIRLYEKGRVKIDNMTQKIRTFNIDDLKGVLRGIIIMQTTYNLSTSDVADGTFGGVKSEPLTAAECQDLMIQAYQEKYIDIANEWRSVALDKVDEGDESTTAVLVFTKAAAAVAIIRNYKEAVSLYNQVFNFSPKSRYHRYRLNSYMRFINNAATTKHKIYNATKLRDKHDACCQGNVPRLMGPLPNDLYCHYDDNGHPLLFIQPVKRELISKDPHIVMYHDVISNRDMINMKALAKHKLNRSLVKVKDKGQRPAPGRTSQSYFLPHNTTEVPKLFTLIEAITSLKKSSYENLQMANYGVCGHYYCHHDYFKDSHFKDDTHDNRIATFMIYMSDIAVGGATAFPLIPEVVFPQKGSAVFWYNLHPNNTLHHDTMHAACPVVVGNKWVGNVWIHRNNNEFTKPCPLDRYSNSWI